MTKTKQKKAKPNFQKADTVIEKASGADAISKVSPRKVTIDIQNSASLSLGGLNGQANVPETPVSNSESNNPGEKENHSEVIKPQKTILSDRDDSKLDNGNFSNIIFDFR